MRFLKQIRERSGLQKSLTNIGWLGGDRMVRMLGAVLVGTAVARYLGPEQFGLLNYGTAIFAIFNIASGLGLELLVVREVALNPAQEPEILGTACILKGVASVATTLTAVIAARLLDPHSETLTIIVALLSTGAIAQAFDVVDYSFQAHTRSRFAVVPRNLVFILGSIARVAGILWHAGLLTFAWIAGGEYLFSGVGLLVSYSLYRQTQGRWKWCTAKAKALLHEGWPLLVSGLMFIIYFRADQVLLGKLSSKAIVGQYSAAIKLSEVWYAIPIVVCASVMPPILKAKESDKERYYARLQRLYEGMIFLSVAVALCTQFTGPFFVRLLYGKDYAMAAGILAVHIWTGVFGFMGAVSSQQLVQEKLSLSFMQRTGIGALVNLALNFALIPRWGGIGSAFATLIAQSVAFYFADAFDRRTRHIFRMKTQACLRFWLLPRLIFAAGAD